MEAVYFENRLDWRRWLESNFKVKNEIWFVFPKVSSGKKRVSYNDAVEEALCFGWIDSIQKSFEQNSTVLRFTPRRPKSTYSQPNKERLRWLYQRSMIHPDILPSVLSVINEKYVFPIDILEILKSDSEVWLNFEKFSEAYKRVRLAYINDARKRPDVFNIRLKNFIEKTKQGKQIKGHGGIDKYY